MTNIERRVGATLLATTLALLPAGCTKTEKDFINCANGPKSNSATVEVLDGKQTKIPTWPGYVYLTSGSEGMKVESNLNDNPVVMQGGHTRDYSTAEPGIYVPEGTIVLKDKMKTIEITHKGRDEDNKSSVVFVAADCKTADK